MVVIYCQPFDGWLHCSTETPVSLVKKLTDIRVEEGSPVPMECEFSRQNVEVKWLKVKNNPHRLCCHQKTKPFSTCVAWPPLGGRLRHAGLLIYEGIHLSL